MHLNIIGIEEIPDAELIRRFRVALESRDFRIDLIRRGMLGHDIRAEELSAEADAYRREARRREMRLTTATS